MQTAGRCLVARIAPATREPTAARLAGRAVSALFSCVGDEAADELSGRNEMRPDVASLICPLPLSYENNNSSNHKKTLLRTVGDTGIQY